MAILCSLHPVFGTALFDVLRRYLPGERLIRSNSGEIDPQAIEASLIWRMTPALTPLLGNSRFLSATGAGVDHLVLHEAIPTTLPVTRVVCPRFAKTMAEYCLTMAVYCARDVGIYSAAQRQTSWMPRTMREFCSITVGLMGLGHLGTAAAVLLRQTGFEVIGWSRAPKQIHGVVSYCGQGELTAFLARAEILINLLPLTTATRGILNANVFSLLPKRASVINVARGAHLVERDLVQAIERGYVGQAVLDTFDVEPLVTSSPIWKHPNILVTPHIAAQASPEAVVSCFSENLRRSRSGLQLLNQVDRQRQY
jgi:glyoxylate/hydroxypyruvate reductase